MIPVPASPFPVTRWTEVVNVCRSEDPGLRAKALDELCRDYWYPLYAFARRQGNDRESAEDLTQGFFHYLLRKDLFAAANQETGKLRTFLLTIFQRYIGDARARDTAQKRGGGKELVSLDLDEGEKRYSLEPADRVTPEELYDRSWAIALLSGSLAAMARNEEEQGRGKHFEKLAVFLNATTIDDGDYDSASAELGMSTVAVRKAVSRLRQRFRECLREQIAATLKDPDEARVDEELMALKSVLRGG
ncbi:RNA polymerase sigma factor [Luteolibacter luteus]|uniref:Sigma-70 family RNA polymerase sigma factor n=1 Tax=Luteolibacter luteus TaxID=2728835 RepID=A0A858RFB6_9BACT|nr:sigma-70 family RNA polymerase sigma factor [Luteolibacter luteus]QJE95129.1 sigma-70 family RNA polymerase sigma factor [Luteolibacter luteus]